MFHVEHSARLREGKAPPPLVSDDTDGNNGCFLFPSVEPGWQLLTIASDGLGWEHVSVHAVKAGKSRVPSWREMAQIKALFWDDDDVVVQFHPRKSEYVNLHPNVLHLWRPIGVELPTPPPELVGPRPNLTP